MRTETPISLYFHFLIFSAIAAAVRVKFGRSAVEPGSREDRVERNHSLDHLFEGRMLKLKLKPKKKKATDSDSESEAEDSDSVLDSDGCKDILRPAAICTDPEELIYKVMLERGLDMENTDIKIGADDGQGIFKLNVQLVSKKKESLDVDTKSRASYSSVSELNLATICNYEKFMSLVHG